MTKRFRHLLLILLLVIEASFSVAGTITSDKVCVGTVRHYWVEGMPLSSYTWQLDGQTLTSTVEYLDIAWTKPGTYTLTVQEHQANCDGELQITVIDVIAPPELEKPQPVMACLNWMLPGISEIKGINLSGNQAFYDKSQADGGKKISGFITQSQTVWIYDPGELPGCGDEVSFEVTIYPPPKLVITDPAPVCSPSTVDLTDPNITKGSDDNLVYTYWVDAAATITLTNASSVSETGTYYIKATNAGGCSTTATVHVTILLPPKLEVHNPLPVCEPASVDISLPVITEGSDKGLVFSYWLDEAATVSLTNYASITDVGTHTYTIMATVPGGCSVTSTVIVTIHPLPKLVVHDPAPVCEPQSVDLTTSFTPETGVTYTYWRDAATTIPLPDYSAITETGTHTFTILAKNTEGCSVTKSVTVTIYPRPTASVNPSDVICPNTTYKVESSDATNYKSLLWETTGDGTFNDTSILHPVYTPGVKDIESGRVMLTISAFGIGSGCETAHAFILIDIVNLQANITASNITCNGRKDGIIKVENIQNGRPTYTLFIDGLQSGSGDSEIIKMGLSAGTHTIRLADSNGCIRDLKSQVILEPRLLTAEIGTFTPTCVGNDGKIYITHPVNAASELVGVPGKYMYSIINEKGTYNYDSEHYSMFDDTYTFGGLATGTYTIKVSDTEYPYCISSLFPPIILVDPEPLVVEATYSDVTCYGANDGTVSITTATGGSGIYEYRLIDKSTDKPWVKGWVKASELIHSVSPGSYALEMRDASDKNNETCTYTASKLILILEPEILAGTATSTNETCWNAKDGTVTVIQASGGHNSYLYKLEGVPADPNDGTTYNSGWGTGGQIKKVPPGTFNLWIADSKSPACTRQIGSFVILPAARIIADVSSKSILCNGEKNGVINLSGTHNGKEPYLYSINNGNTWTTTTAFIGLEANTYTVTIMDANKCSNVLDPIVIEEPKKISADYVHSIEMVNGQSLATITIVDQEGGTPIPGADPYMYSINNAATWQKSPEFKNITPGSYTVTISDLNNCRVSIPVTVKEVGLISAKFDIQNVSCNGETDGKITFSSFSGAASGKYEISINNGLSWEEVKGSNAVVSQLGSGLYDLIVREYKNPDTESDLGRWPITQPNAIQATVLMTQPETGTTKNGIITVTSASGGSGSFVYRMNGGAWQSTNVFKGLAKGDYIIDIADQNSTRPGGCFISKTISVGSYGELTASVDITHPRCYGLAGTIKITGSGVTKIQYYCSLVGSNLDDDANWSDSNLFNVYDGEYVVAVRDASNHTNKLIVNGPSSGNWKITQPCEVKIILFEEYSPTCKNQYSIYNISFEKDASCPGQQITGDLGLHKLASGQSTTYFVYNQNYISGQPGCMASQSVSSQMPPSIDANIVPTPSKCYGGTGTITFEFASNGTPPYTYSVKSKTINRSSATNPVFGDLTSGVTYTCTVTDSQGCKFEKAIDLAPMFPVRLEITPLSSLCSKGSVDIVMKATGGDDPYYLNGKLLIGTITQTINLDLGTQTFTVTDNNGCTGTSIIGPTEPPVLEVVSPPLKCNDTFASLTVVKPGYDESRYQYSLNGGEWTTSVTWDHLSLNTSYTISVFDKLIKCSNQVVVTTQDMAIPSAPEITLVKAPTCLNEDGTLIVTKPVGPQYAYRIVGKNYLTGGKTQTSTTFSNLKTDKYSIKLINTLAGCESLPTEIDVPAVPPTPKIVANGISPRCYGDTYTITVTVPKIISNGKTYNFDGIYTFYYNGSEKFERDILIANGTATITGVLTESKAFNNIYFIASGCTSTGTATSVNIGVPEPIQITKALVTEQALKGTQRGAIELTVTGGEPNLSYLWTSSTFTGTVTTTTPNLTNLWNGTYTLTITDRNNCMLRKDYKIPLNNPPVALPDDYLYSCIPLHENLLVNDYDPDPAEQMDFVRIKTTPNVLPKHAKNFKINANGTFDYEVMPGFTGMLDSFEYEIEDKFGQTATATVTITIVADFDGDGIANEVDDDADGDGILNVDEVLPGQDWKTADYDNDGHPNWLDIDSDNDGIIDNIEAQSTASYVEPSGIDKNNNGIDDIYDPAAGGKKIVPVNTDATLYKPDNLPDFLDTDSDNDQVPDYIEGHDEDSDGKPDRIFVGKDTDSDGLDDAYDTVENGCNNFNSTGAYASLQDYDKDLIRDWRDDNDDDDEFPTRLEDLNADGDFSNDVTGHVGHPEYLWKGRDCELFIPDAFSPNDDYVHDFFEIYCIEAYPNAKMYIFDQQGNKLFEKDHYGNVDFWGSHEKAWWDGTTTNRTANVNGKKVVPGTYYYVLRLGNGEVKKSFVFVSY